MKARLLRRGVAAAALAAALGGCAMAPQLQRVAVDHNRMVAATEDELALLNVVRAAHRFPLHFTAITAVNGDASLSVSAGLGIGLEPGPDPQSGSLGAGASTNPNFQATVLATDAFQRGIQAPIKSELVAYFLDEGWRDELIMALFIERIDVFASSETGERERVISNEPEAGSDFARLLCTHELVSRPSTASRPLAQFAQLIDIDKINAASSSAEDRRKEIAAYLELANAEGVQLVGETLFLDGSLNSVELVARSRSRCPGVAADTSGAVLRPRLRSTLGIIYFLGEYLRTVDEGGAGAAYLLPSCKAGCAAGTLPMRPLMVVREGSGEALVATRFRDRRFYISAEEGESLSLESGGGPRSMQILDMIQQLINLQKSADTLPTSISFTGAR